MANSKKKMNNITTVKVNPFEIAKATDMDFGFKNVLANFSILADWFYGFHLGEIDEKLFKTPLNVGASNQDFIIGGGFVSAGDTTLRVLPVLACSKEGGLFITNGLDVDNRPIEISFGSNFTSEGFRIESVFIGNAETGTWDGSTAIKDKKDPNWDDYQSEWRASYRLLQGSEETVFSEFKKRQMQAVRFYIYPGIIRKTGEEAKAADVSKVDAFRERVKIAEVLVHCKLDAGNVPRIQPIKQEDVRFVTARTYFDGTFAEAVKKDDRWLGRGKTEAEKTERAEHYNRLWTSEHLRTYRLGSVSEISERIDKIHKKDGTLKEEVVWNRHINLNPSDENSLRGDLIPIGQPDSGSGKLDIPLRYDKKIKSAESIKQGMNNTADVLNEHIDRTQDVHGATSSTTPNRIAIRDSKGGFEVETPSANNDLNAVNVKYLNARIEQFKVDVTLKVLKSKLITTQIQYNNWINAGKDDAYTYVYLEGNFKGAINFGVIATKEVNVLGNTRIEGFVEGNSSRKVLINIKNTLTINAFKEIEVSTNEETEEWKRWEGQKPDKDDYNSSRNYKNALDNWKTREPKKYKTAIIKEVVNKGISNVTVSGKKLIVKGAAKVGVDHCNLDGLKECEVDINGGYNKTIGFYGCDNCDGYTATVKGYPAVGFEYCITRDCTAFVSGADGVDGNSGGDAIGFDHCTVIDCQATCYGGKGGKGRSGSTPSGHGHGGDGTSGKRGGDAYSAKNCQKTTFVIQKLYGGNGGDGGDGGDVYVYDGIDSGVRSYKVGKYGAPGAGGAFCDFGKSKGPGDYGKWGNIHYIY